MLNQIGYYPGAAKVAIVTGNVSANTFYVTTTNQRDTLHTGKLNGERKSLYSSVVTHIADFSSLKKKGSYVVVLPGVGNSYVFEIDNMVAPFVYLVNAIEALSGKF